MKYVWLAALLLGAGVNGYAQTQGNTGLLPNILGASPEAASLGKFGEWPVSQYTGVPDISYPIYTIKIKDVSIPIQLSYHASGIRVDEMASWVGTGWTLNAGGALSRTVVGVADDDTYGLMTAYRSGQYLKGNYSLTDSNDYVFFRRLADQTADADPDIYYYNFAGISGKFCFDSTGSFHAIPANNLQIVQSAFATSNGVPPTNTEWIIDDEKGNTFIFGSTDAVTGGTNGVERTNSGNEPLHVENSKTTGWYLTKVVTRDRADTIYFDYGSKSEFYYLPPQMSINGLLNPQTLPSVTYPPGGGWLGILDANETLYNGNPTLETVQAASQTSGASTLQHIRWRGGRIDFIANTTRQDMVDALPGVNSMLDSIYIYNNNNTMLYGFGLSYTYVQNRYFLDSVRQTSSDKSIALPTKYNYINRNLLPVGASLNGIPIYDQDHWGYYNGAGNSTLLPMDANLLQITGVDWTDLMSANREPDTVKMQYGTLNKVVFPTGGSTVFTYESNRYDASTTTVTLPPKTIVVTNTAGVIGNTSSPYRQLSAFTPGITQSRDITVNVFNYAHPPQKNMTWLPYFILYGQNQGGPLQQIIYSDAFDNFPTGGVTANPNGYYSYSYTISNITLNAGWTYTLVASDTCLKTINCADLQVPMPNVDATLQYSTYTQSSPGGGPEPLPIAGGLRIKAITDYDQAGNFAREKTFSYSPGDLLDYPAYDRRYQTDIAENASTYSGVPTCSPMEADMWQLFSTSQVLLGVTQGSPVGYSLVTEKDVDASGNDNGYTNYSFSFSGDSANILQFDAAYTAWSGTQILNPMVPFNNFDYKRGLLLSKDVYAKNASGTYVKIQSIVNNYNFNDFNYSKRYARIRGLRTIRMRGIHSLDGQYNCSAPYNGYDLPISGQHFQVNDFAPDFGFAFYDIISAWVQKTNTTIINYDQNGLNPVTSVTSYYYDNPLHMNPTRITTNRSNRDSITTLMTYPQDYASGTPFIDSLVTHHAISLPIEKVHYKRDALANITILDGRISTYLADGKGLPSAISLTESAGTIPLSSFKFSNISGAGTLPVSGVTRASFSADATYTSRADFLNYDSYKNIVQDAKSSDMNQSYIWDYRGLYPIAAVKNAGISDIAYTSFEADGSGSWSIPDTTRIRTGSITGNLSYKLTGANSIVRSGLSGAAVYIVGYWGQSGNAITVNGSPGRAKATFGSWTYYEDTVKNATAITVGGTGFIDELRLYPKGALMTTYTFAPLFGISCICDESCKLTYYTYDGIGRLKLVTDEYGNILKRYDYQYQSNNN